MNLKKQINGLAFLLDAQAAHIDKSFVDTTNEIEVTLHHIRVEDIKEYAEEMGLHLYKPDDTLPFFWCTLSDDKKGRWKIKLRSVKLDVTMMWKEAAEL